MPRDFADARALAANRGYEVTPSDAIAAGLTPRQLEAELREHVGELLIAHKYGLHLSEVETLMKRWQLWHLSKRGKSDRTITIGVQQ